MWIDNPSTNALPSDPKKAEKSNESFSITLPIHFVPHDAPGSDAKTNEQSGNPGQLEKQNGHHEHCEHHEHHKHHDHQVHYGLEHPEKTEQPQQLEKTEQPQPQEKTEQPQQPEKTEQPQQPGKTEQPQKPGKTEKSGQLKKPEEIKNPENTEKSA